MTTIMLGSEVVKAHDAAGLARSMLEQLRNFGAVDQQLEGVAADGQYVKLGIKQRLLQQINVSFCSEEWFTVISDQSLDVDGKHVTDNNAVAQTMNDFFCDIGKSLSDKIPQKANPLVEDKLEVNPENLQFKLQAFDVPQIKKVFGKFKTSKGFGPDGIANHFLKIAFSVIA